MKATVVALVAGLCLLARIVTGQEPPPPLAEPTVPFSEWLAGLTAEARARGFEQGVIERTLGNLEPLPRVVANDRNQAELTLTLDRYLASRVTPLMIRRGRELSRSHQTLLSRIEKTYGVPRQYVLAIWGVESRFGRLVGRTPVFRALATLAWEPRRSEFFRDQLFQALRMVASGAAEPSRMTGSWAGAMGQTQFMPSSYLEYAQDFDGDGRRDIWTSVPDALASIAAYLKGYGWQTGESWGREVDVTTGVRTVAMDLPKRDMGCYAVRSMTTKEGLTAWRRRGLSGVDGRALPASDIDASLAIVGDRAFLVYQNYEALLGYNCAHFYALSVALLADELR